MSAKTPFAGYEVLDPAESLSADGFAFQSVNPRIADRVARLGVRDHRHDGHAGMVDPTEAVVVTTTPSGGAIPAGTAIYVTYTLNDSDGGETLPVATVTVVTPAGISDPDAAPGVVVDYGGGTLLAASYSYALTIADGVGGETGLGPAVTAIIAPGHANAEATLSGLAGILTDAGWPGGAGGWRLWRTVNGGVWYLIATGTDDSFTDDGVAGDCSVEPPFTGTTEGANALRVTVPTDPPAGTAQYSVYADFDGSFLNPCRLGTYDVSDLGTLHEYATLDPLVGAPPTVSSCFDGAQPIDMDTDTNGPWRTAVATAADLPSVGNASGDLRETLDDHAVHAWDQPTVAWVLISGGGGGSTIAESEYTADFNIGDSLADAGKVLEVDSPTPVTATVLPGAYPVDTVMEVYQRGAGAVTFVAGAGVTLESYGGLVATAGAFATVGLRQRAADVWVLTGKLA